MKKSDFLRPLVFSFIILSTHPALYGQPWTQLGSDILGLAVDDEFGRAISVSGDGNRVAIASPLHDGVGSDAGQVRIFSGPAWAQLGSSLDGEAMDDRFGWSIDLSKDGNTLAVGAYFNDGNGFNSGSVRVFRWNGTDWIQLGGDIDGENAGDYFGVSVALSSNGNTLVAGASLNDDNGTRSGHVRIFTWNGSSWVSKGSAIAGAAADDRFGVSVDIDNTGDIIVAGASTSSVNGSNSGQVRAYDWDGMSWTQLGGNLNGKAAEDYFGLSVCINETGDRIAAGAIRNDMGGTNAGQVSVYSYNGSIWQQFGNEINGDAPDDELGIKVAMGQDGDALAIGAFKNDNGGADAGRVKVYYWDGNSWVQRGGDIDGSNADDYFGRSVDINSGGDVVAVGAPQNDQAGSNAGMAALYQRNTISIFENHINLKFSFYPNPAERELIFEGDIPDKVQLISLNGIVIKEWSQVDRLELKDVDRGVYIVRVQRESETFEEKLIIE